MNTFLSLLAQMIAVAMISLVVLFIIVNIMVGCESWQNENCITPMQMVE